MTLDNGDADNSSLLGFRDQSALICVMAYILKLMMTYTTLIYHLCAWLANNNRSGLSTTYNFTMFRYINRTQHCMVAFIETVTHVRGMWRGTVGHIFIEWQTAVTVFSRPIPELNQWYRTPPYIPGVYTHCKEIASFKNMWYLHSVTYCCFSC